MKQPFSTWFFVRSYAAIVAAIIGTALLLDVMLATLQSGNNELELANQYAPLLSLLQEELARGEETEPESWLAQLSERWGIQVQLIPLSDFAGLEPVLGESSADIHLFYDSNDAPLLYQPVPGSSLVLALGPLADYRSRNSSLDTFVFISYYALIALVLLIWIRPFYRDLSLLRSAAADFGKDDFSTRVRLSEKSSILPVAQSFNSMAERIEYLVSAHRELTNAVSHELRTPLARFKFSLEILARSKDPARQQEYLDRMKEDVAELEGLIDEMLGYAKLGEHNLLMDLVDVNLQTWLQDQLSQYSSESIAVICSFSSLAGAESCRVSLNPELMARAVHNIIRNGLRYARSEIKLQIECGELVTISISDDGPGIADKLLTRIFEPFSRLENSQDERSGGYGLGLAIAARILQRHQGTIKVANQHPQGACFTLQWPRQRTS